MNLFYFFVKSPKVVEGFLYAHDGSGTPRSRAMKAYKIKLFGILFFFNFLQNNQTFDFLSPHSSASRCPGTIMRM